MTDKIEWGPEIAVNGVRPDWLGDTDKIQWNDCRGYWGRWMVYGFVLAADVGWQNITAIKLPADHPAYTVQAWNEAHPDEEPFVPWCGGGEAPGDWDGGDVLMYNCRHQHMKDWRHHKRISPYSVYGYRRRKEPASEPVAPPGYVLVKQMSEGEARVWLGDEKPGWCSQQDTMLMVMRWLDIIRPETRLEQFVRANPHVAITDGNRDAVVAALEWGKDHV